MSTRSVIAVPNGSGWKGRYCHSDGYPTWNGRVLWALVQRDGLETVRKRITEDRYGWSFLDGEAEQELTSGRSDGRFAAEPGYGIAYTTVLGQSNPDEWISKADLATGDDWGTEWFYVLGDDALTVGVNSGGGKVVATVPWSSPEPDWAKIERKGDKI